MVCIIYNYLWLWSLMQLLYNAIYTFYEFSNNVRLLEELNKYMLLQQCIRKLNCSCVNIKCAQLLNTQLQITIYGINSI